jgi:hypothetical protein
MIKLFAALLLGCAAAVAEAANADPQAERAAREFLKAVNQQALVMGTLQEVQRSVPANASAKQIADRNSMIQKMMADPAFMEQLVAQTVPIYTQRFTTAELKELTAFYKSAVGKRFVALAPDAHKAVLTVNRKVIGEYLARQR